MLFSNLILNDAFRKYSVKTILLLVEKVVRLSGLFGIMFIITKQLSEPDFAKISLVFSVTLILISISNYGLHSYTINKLSIARDMMERYTIINSTIFFKYGLSLLLVALLILFCFFFQNNEYSKLLIYSSLSLLFQPFVTLEAWFESFNRITLYVVFKILTFLLFIGLILIFLNTDDPVFYLSFYYVVDIALKVIAMIAAFFIENYRSYSFQIHYGYIRELIRNGYLLMLSSFGAILNLKVDQIIILYFLEKADLALYSFALIFIEGTFFVALILSNSLFPLITERYREGSFIQQVCSIFFLVSVLVGVLINLLSYPVIDLFYLDKYPDAHLLILLLSPVLIFVSQKMLLIKFLIIEKRYDLLFRLEIAGAIVNIALNTLFIPLMGIYGAILASIISYAIVSYFGLLYFKSTRKVFKFFTNAFFLKNLFYKKHERMA